MPNPARFADDAGDAVRQVIRAYHGSPYDFDKFDASKIGTGEGAQAYGYGMYFAGAEPTAQSYRDTLSGQLAVDGRILGKDDPHRDLAHMLALGDDPGMLRRLAQAEHDRLSDKIAQAQEQFNNLGGWESDATAGLPAKIAELKARRGLHADRLAGLDYYEGKKVGYNRGHMYEVEVAHPESALLDWDAPLSAQPQALKFFQRMSTILPDEPPLRLLDRAIEVDSSGGHAYGKLQDALSENAETWKMPDAVGNRVSKQLVADAVQSGGFPGIRYLDQVSRQQGINYGPTGTRNYVMFPGTEDSIRILRKYGLMAPIAAGAAAQSGGGE
jgi:hypothetical protein